MLTVTVSCRKKKKNRGKKKKSKKFPLTFALSHSPISQMQAPISSEEAAHSPLHLLSITARDIAVMDEMVAE